MLTGKTKTVVLFIKSFIYRIYSSIIAFLVAYAFTGNAKLSAYIGIVENVLKIATYYWFDLIWNKLAVKNYKNCVVFLTGLSGAGKTTIAKKLFEELQSQGKSSMILDGDEIREIFKNTGFDKKSRDEHVKNVGRTAAFLQRRGTIAIVSMIAPYKDIRKECRDMATDFVEVYVDTPLSVCENRDVKGLYKKARAGEIKQFTGIHSDAPYEAPTSPDIIINTTNKTVDECVEQILMYIRKV